MNPIKKSTISVLLLFFIIFASFICVVYVSNSDSVAGSDTYGYLQGAVSIAKNGFFNAYIEDPLIPKLAALFTDSGNKTGMVSTTFLAPQGYYVRDFKKGILYSYYPIGFSYIIRVFSGLISPYLIVPALSLFFALGLTWYFKKLFGNVFALLLASSILFIYPFLRNATQLMSDISSLIFLFGGFVILIEGLRKESLYMTIAAGILLGYSITIRYVNAVSALAAVLLFTSSPDKFKARYYRLIFYAAGLFLGAAPLLMYRHKLFGNILYTVGGNENLAYILSASYFPMQVRFYGPAILKTEGMAGTAVIAIGVINLLGRGDNNRKGVIKIMAMLVASYAFIHLFYCSSDTRYLLPVFIIFSIFFALGGERIFEFVKKRSVLFSNIILALLILYPMINFFDFSLNKKVYFNQGIKYIDHFSPKQLKEHYSVKIEVPSYKKALLKKYFNAILKKGLSAKIDVGFKGIRTLCGEIKDRTNDHAVIFCNDLSGPLRLYSDLTTYGFLPKYDKYFTRVCEYLEENGFNIYVYIDSEESDYHKEEILYLEYLKKTGKFNIRETGSVSRGTLLEISLP